MKKGKKNILFQTSKQSSSGKNKRFFAVFFLCFIGVLAISLIAILSKYDFNIKSVLGISDETQAITETQQTNQQKISSDKTYFFWCAESDRSKLHFAWIVRFELPGRIASVYALPGDISVDRGGTAQTLAKIYSSAGENGLVEAVEAYSGRRIDGYACSTNESFKTMINYFGGVDIAVPEQIEYRGDEFTLILVKGRQNLKGDSLFKYLRYLNTLGDRGNALQSAALLDMLDGVFRPENLNRADNIFSKISNTIKTNVTIVEFSSMKAGIEELMEKGLLVKKTIESPEEF